MGAVSSDEKSNADWKYAMLLRRKTDPTAGRFSVLDRVVKVEMVALMMSSAKKC